MIDTAPRAASPEPAVRGRRRPAIGTVLLALIAYVPLLFTRAGQVGADTKTYLYLDPGRLLARAAWMWDPNIGFGTVTHQNIGYLWPMGPYYWLMDAVGLPDWIAQRLWLGSIIFTAGMGVRFMLKELRWVGSGVTVASFAYALSPYLLDYGSRISVILLPFAGLPWLIGMASRSLRRGGWRWPAAFALVTLTVGGVNATSLLLVMAGPLLWFVHTVFIAREVAFRRALAVGLRITALTAITSLWWIAGLAVQGTYGIAILRYTETYHTVANAALSTELFRGLGYWFFYGRDALGAWIAAAERMVQSIPSLVLSFTIPGLALVAGFLTRFRNRGYFALLVATGLLLGVGAHPWDSPTPAGALFKAWTRTDSGLAFRSSPRAVPLIALGVAVMLGAGVAALGHWRPAWRPAVSGALIVLICLNQWALFGGEMVDRNLRRDEHLPGYWLEAASAIDSDTAAADTRVYEMPGTDFASYRWGNTVDPITPGLIDRPYAARELIPYGTPASADLLNAWDVPLQQGGFDPATVQPMSQLLGIGTIAHRGDLQYERFRTPRPRSVWHMLTHAPGLEEPETFGDRVPNRASSRLPLDDEVYFGTPSNWRDAPAVSLFGVEDPRPILRSVSADSPTVLAGDGAGIVNWAATGALDPDRPILYSAAYATDPAQLDRLIGTPGSQLVVTDTNRRAARRWGSVRENDGYTERAGEEPLEPDPADNRLDVFPGAGDATRTVSEQIGGATVTASSYGNPVSYTPGDRAVMAMDGDPDTAWRVGAFDEPRGEYLQIAADHIVNADHFTLLQSRHQGNRWITGISLSLDGGSAIPVSVGDASRSLPGQRIDLPDSTFTTLRITVTDTNIGVLDRYVGVSDVGVAEVSIPGVAPVSEVIRPPTDLLDAAGADAIDHPLTYVFTRRHANPSEVVVTDEEARIKRLVEGDQARRYTVFGKARVSTRLDDFSTDKLLGVASALDGSARVSSSAHLPGDIRSRGTSAFDGDMRTAWQTPINGSVGQWVQLDSPVGFRFDELTLSVVRDGHHSIPTEVSVSVDGAKPIRLALPETGLGDDKARGAVKRVPLKLPPQVGHTVRVTIEDIRDASSKDWFGGSRTVLPVGIADIDVGPSVVVPPANTPLDDACRDDLLTLDGRPVRAKAVGTVGDALDRDLIDLRGCETPDIPGGQTLLESEPGASSGLDVDQVVLASAAGGGPGPDTLVDGPAKTSRPPHTSGSHPGRLTWKTEVNGAREPYWVVLGQSFSPGFEATTADGTDLGAPQLVNGYANGWLVDPAKVGSDATITIRWTPQRTVWAALALSVLGVLLCVALLIRPPRLLAGVPRTDPLADPLVGPGADSAMEPIGVRPFGVRGGVISLERALVAAFLAALTGFVFMGWAVGVVLGVTAGVALLNARGQIVLRIAGIGLFAAAAGYVIAKQTRYSYLLDFNWMNQFEITHAWTLAAVALLVLDPVVTHLRGSSPTHPSPPEDPIRDTHP